jgi:multidrug efflux pump
MISRFFIDRPIFATVLSILITLIGGIALFTLPLAQYPRITPPGVQVAISYPGASAKTVADTVAAPIEQQVTGVPGMLYMSSQSGNDGSYTLSVTFQVGVDLNTALVMVQNRVALAMPLLPSSVQNQGITIRKKTPDILMIVNLFSPKGTYDDIYLSNYALINLKDEMLRVDGVSDVSILGERDYSIRAWLDPQKLASRNMTAGDVANAIRSQNLEAPAGQVGQPPSGRGQSFQLPIDTLGRLSDPEQFGEIIVKVGSGSPKPLARARGGPVPAGSGLPGSGIADPLQAAGAMTGPSTPTTGSTGGTTTGATTSSATTTSATTASGTITVTGLTGGAATGGGATATGGGTTAGGGATGGGGTTGGGANASAASADMTGLSITDAATTSPGSSVVLGGATASRPPPPPSTGIVRLRDVARVEMGAQNYNISCTFDGRPSVGLGVYQLPGTNALDVADRVRAKMEELKKRFPDDLIYQVGYDTTPYISESINEVYNTLLDAVILVSIVVLLFLQDWKAMILPMIDVPVSLIGTFGVMAAMGFSLNNISLFGLVLAIGIVVDDAIVVLENIERQMAKGFDVRTATIKAMDEISGPILGITLALCAVFVPCAFISGITGRFFKQFAVTIAASTVISAVNALTMTPSRALLVFKTEEGAGGHAHKKEALPWWIFGPLGGALTVWLGPRLFQISDFRFQISWMQSAILFMPGALAGLVFGWFLIRPVNRLLGVLFGGFNRAFDGVTGLYGWTLGKGMRLSVVVLLLYGGLLALTYGLFQEAPTGFVPQQDMGRCIASIQLPDSSSLERTKAAMAQVDKIVRETPGVAHTITICGLSFVQQANSSNFGSLFIILKPFSERQRPELKDEAIMKRLRKQCAEQVKDAQMVVFGSSPIPGLSVAGGFKVQVEDKAGLGLPSLQDQADRLIQKVKDLKVKGQPALASVSTQFRSNTPQLFMDIDRAKVAALGVAFDDVNQTLGVYLGSLYVNSFNEFGRHWQVTLQAEGRYRSRVEDINLLQVRNKLGQMVPLGTLVNMREISGPIFVLRYNLSTAAPITGGLLPGISSGDVIAGVDQLSNESLPRSMKTEWTELMYVQIVEGNTTLLIFGLSVMFVFLALSALYESWALPLAIILVVPLCVLCSVAGVLFSHNSVNIFVQIGLVVLVGLACKNAILIVEFAKDLHDQGRSIFEATLEASKLRLRPILMTSLAFILGVVPLVLAHGAGAEMRRSLGTAVFSGMLGVTLFGIFLTPVFFYVIQGLGETRLFASVVTQWVTTAVLGALLGLAGGYLLARLGVVSFLWGPVVGACAGTLTALSVHGIHQKIRG